MIANYFSYAWPETIMLVTHFWLENGFMDSQIKQTQTGNDRNAAKAKRMNRVTETLSCNNVSQ